MNLSKKYWLVYFLLHSKKSKSENKLLNEKEFRELTEPEKTAFVFAYGIHVAERKRNQAILILYKCPLFYAEWCSHTTENNWDCFTSGQKLIKYIDLVRIHDLGDILPKGF